MQWKIWLSLAAAIISCALGHTWRPYADCNMSRGPGSAWPCFPYVTKRNFGQAPLTKKNHTRNTLSPNALSHQWQQHLELTLSNPPGRVRAYVHWHLHNKHKRSMYKPAPYLTHQSCHYQFELFIAFQCDTATSSTSVFAFLSAFAFTFSFALAYALPCVHWSRSRW